MNIHNLLPSGNIFSWCWLLSHYQNICFEGNPKHLFWYEYLIWWNVYAPNYGHKSLKNSYNRSLFTQNENILLYIHEFDKRILPYFHHGIICCDDIAIFFFQNKHNRQVIVQFYHFFFQQKDRKKPNLAIFSPIFS